MPQFGTVADFDALLAGVHQGGMRLVLDLAVNHSWMNTTGLRKAAPAGPTRAATTAFGGHRPIWAHYRTIGSRFFRNWPGMTSKRMNITCIRSLVNSPMQIGNTCPYINPNHMSINVTQRETHPQSVLDFYRRLLRWRKQMPVLHEGLCHDLLPDQSCNLGV